MTVGSLETELNIYCKFLSSIEEYQYHPRSIEHKWQIKHRDTVKKIISMCDEEGIKKPTDPTRKSQTEASALSESNITTGYEDEDRLPSYDSSSMAGVSDSGPDIEPRLATGISKEEYEEFSSVAKNQNVKIEPFFINTGEEIYTPLRYMTVRESRKDTTQTKSDNDLKAIFPCYDGSNIIRVVDALKSMVQKATWRDLYQSQDSEPKTEKSWHHYVNDWWDAIVDNNSCITDRWEIVEMEFDLRPQKKEKSEACDLLLTHKDNNYEKPQEDTPVSEPADDNLNDEFSIFEIKQPEGDLKSAVGQVIIYGELLRINFNVPSENINLFVGGTHENSYVNIVNGLDLINFIDVFPPEHKLA